MGTGLPLEPTLPGEMLLEEFLKPMGLTQSAFAEHLGVSFKGINEIVRGRRSVTPETAWLFSQALGTRHLPFGVRRGARPSPFALAT